MGSLQRYCGLPDNGSYVVYVDSDKTFGRCFLWTAFSYTSHLIFAITCAYHLGVSKMSPRNRKSYLVLGACVVTLLSALCDLIEVIINYALSSSREQHPPAYVLSKTISFTSWLVCFLLQWKTMLITKEKKLQSKYLIATLILLILSSSMQLQFVDDNIGLKHYSIQDIPVDYVGVMVVFSLNIIFLLLCVAIILSKTTSVDSYGDLSEETKSVNEEDENEEVENIYLGEAETTRNVLSKLIYWWSDRLLYKGYKGQLKEPDDLFLLPNNLNTMGMKTLMVENMKKERDRLTAGTQTITEQTTVQVSLFTVLRRCFGKVYFGIGVLKLFSNILQLVQPVLVNLLVTFVSDQSEPIDNGYYYTLAFLLTTLFSVIFDLQYKYHMAKVNLRVRAALVSVIYEKSLKVRASSLNKLSTGKIVNLMSTDTDRTRNFCNNFHECWSVPFQLIVCMGLLYQQVGVAFLPTLLYCILLVPLAKHVTRKVMRNQMMVVGQRDKRLKMIVEILVGIRVIKYNAWETHFAKIVDTIRKKELKYSFMIKLIMGAVGCLWNMSISVMAILTIGAYVLMGNELTAASAFTVMAVIQRLVGPLNSFSWNINALIDAKVSCKRIENYLCLPEICLDEYYTKDSIVSPATDVAVEGGTFRWNLKEVVMLAERKKSSEGCCVCCRRNKNASVQAQKQKPQSTGKDSTSAQKGKKVEDRFELRDISICIKRGKLTGVMGRVGSGKSSLFASITAEMEKYGGLIHMNEQLDGIALVTQEPWIQHLSIRDNILFGREYDEARYDNVLHACALIEDINLFPSGDLTEIGENGVNLSGGQKARIALARAVYQDKDMYLLDDPIAAVDQHVAKHIYNHCIMGLLKEKTRVLCTHHTKYLRQADHVIVLNDGVVEAQGNPNEILEIIEAVDVEEKTEEATEKQDEEEAKEDPAKTAKTGKLVDTEEKRTGKIDLKVFKLYFTSFGSMLALSTLACVILIQVGKNMQDWWLSYWVSNSEDAKNNNDNDANNEYPLISSSYVHMLEYSKHEDLDYYLPIYGYIVVGYLLFLIVRAITHAFGSIQASRVLHNLLLEVVMATPVSFFDATPVGRIVNRFSTDMSDIDGKLPFFLQMTCRQIAALIGSLVLICISLPWFAIMIVPLGLVYYWIQLVYRRSSRELKRIGAVARSPIYEHFTETLSGYMVIRAFRDTPRFIAANVAKLDKSQRSEYNEQLAALWLTFRLDLIGVVMVTAASLLAVLEHSFGTTNAGMIGLAITYSIQITPSLSRLVTIFTEAEKQMVRVERISQYVYETPRERTKSTHVDLSWPNSGNISIEGVYFKYRENLPFALDDVTLEIKAGEKIGICGRTGSGKSTFLKILFNVVEISSGSVSIDDVNINDVDNSILRSRMSIIPQDPFLFADTVSKNLDPTGKFSSYEMLDVLDKCHLRKLVSDLGGLEGKIEERGSNLSTGQKQLLCLARALLKKAKIICIDEATASVDLETDKLIQVTIREEFSGSTVLTIAHRMNTIIDSNRVLVMNAGKVAEFAPPDDLLADTNSEFYALVNKSTSTTN